MMEGISSRPSRIEAACGQIVEARDVVGEGGCVHGDFGMRVGTQQLRTLRTDRAITKRRPLGRTANDTDVLGHCGAVSPGAAIELR